MISEAIVRDTSPGFEHRAYRMEVGPGIELGWDYTHLEPFLSLSDDSSITLEYLQGNGILSLGPGDERNELDPENSQLIHIIN
jgi:hypothetical protein